MSAFPESDLIELRARFPLRDVDRMATDCATKHARQPFRDPLAMLAKWCETAERKDTHRLDQPPADDTPQGMFRADGSWDRKGHGDPAMHRLVDMLVTARRRDYPPDRIVNRILDEPSAERAFPNASTWFEARDWWFCPASTSAEQCVKDAGRGGSISMHGEAS